MKDGGSVQTEITKRERMIADIRQQLDREMKQRQELERRQEEIEESITRREGRIAEIRAAVEKSTSDYDREKLQERLAKLVGGVAVIRIGAATETEMRERKALIDDARAATQAALEEGIVPGGGVALIRIQRSLCSLDFARREVEVFRSTGAVTIEATVRPAALEPNDDGELAGIVTLAHEIDDKESVSFALVQSGDELLHSGCPG